MNADDTAVIADMERDAKRYRWLRDHHDDEVVESVAGLLRRKTSYDMDAAIDDAIANEERK